MYGSENLSYKTLKETLKICANIYIYMWLTSELIDSIATLFAVTTSSPKYINEFTNIITINKNKIKNHRCLT